MSQRPGDREGMYQGAPGIHCLTDGAEASKERRSPSAARDFRGDHLNRRTLKDYKGNPTSTQPLHRIVRWIGYTTGPACLFFAYALSYGLA
jgi:hypothetical protein